MLLAALLRAFCGTDYDFKRKSDSRTYRHADVLDPDNEPKRTANRSPLPSGILPPSV